jgi:hypothetical protein
MWATRTITALWEYVHNAWTLHNDTVHAHDGAKTEDTDLKTWTQFRIIRLHQRRDETMAMHRDYFFEDPTTTLNTTTLNFQRNWLNLYERAILESIKMAQAESIKDTPSLTEYFVTIRPGITPQPKFDKRHHKTKRRRKHIVHTKNIPKNHRLPRYFITHAGASTITQNPSPQMNRILPGIPLLNSLIHNPYLTNIPTTPRQLVCPTIPPTLRRTTKTGGPMEAPN